MAQTTNPSSLDTATEQTSGPATHRPPDARPGHHVGPRESQLGMPTHPRRTPPTSLVWSPLCSEGFMSCSSLSTPPDASTFSGSPPTATPAGSTSTRPQHDRNSQGHGTAQTKPTRTNSRHAHAEAWARPAISSTRSAVDLCKRLTSRLRFCIERIPANVALVQLVTIERDPLLGHHLKKHTARRIQLLDECLLPFLVTPTKICGERWQKPVDQFAILVDRAQTFIGDRFHRRQITAKAADDNRHSWIAPHCSHTLVLPARGEPEAPSRKEKTHRQPDRPTFAIGPDERTFRLRSKQLGLNVGGQTSDGQFLIVGLVSEFCHKPIVVAKATAGLIRRRSDRFCSIGRGDSLCPAR